MNSSLVSNFDHLRDWNPNILLKEVELKALKAITKLLRKAVSKIKKLRLFISNQPPPKKARVFLGIGSPGHDAQETISHDALMQKLRQIVEKKETQNEFSTL